MRLFNPPPPIPSAAGVSMRDLKELAEAFDNAVKHNTKITYIGFSVPEAAMIRDILQESSVEAEIPFLSDLTP